MAYSVEQITKAANITQSWLEGEHDYQFGKGVDNFGADMQTRLKYIMEDETPGKWFRGKVYEKGGASEQASQQLMKVLAATRAVAVLTFSVSPAEEELRSELTFNELAKFYEHLADADIAPYRRRLHAAQFSSAIEPLEYTYKNRHEVARPAFLKVAGIAVAHLCELEDDHGAMVLPAPGLPSGEIRPWKA